MPLTFKDLDETEASEQPLPASSGGTLTFADLDATEGDSALRSSLAASLPADPDKAAEAKQLQGVTGIPAPAIERNIEPVRRQADARAIEDATRGSPALTRRMSDPRFARLAHDDALNLAAVERLFRTEGFAAAGALLRKQREAKGNAPLLRVLTASQDSLRATPGTVGRGLAQALPQTAGDIRLALKQGIADTFGDRYDQEAVLYERRKADAEKASIQPEFETSLGRGLYGGGRSLVQQAPALALSVLTGSPVPALTAAGGTTGAEAYGRYRGRGASPLAALGGAGGEATVEILTELLPMKFMVDKLGRAGAGEFIAGMLARDLPTEQVATLVQDALDTAIANPDKTWTDYMAERKGAAFETALATLVQSGAIGAVHTAARAMGPREDQVQAADAGAEAVQQLADLAKASALAQRDPDSFQQFVDEAAADGPVSEVYVDGKVFAQSLEQAGVPLEQVQAALPESAAQLAEAVGTGGLVRIPVGEFAAKIASTDLGAALLPHLKVDPNGMSQTEAQEFMQSAAEELRASAEKQIAEQPAVDQFVESARAVETDLLGQLRGAGRFTEDVSRTYAALASSFYGTLAQRLGVQPQELYERYPLKVQAELPVDDFSDLVGFEQPAFHGTPHDIGPEGFKTDKIGTGEGAQSYGWGLYFAENPAVAEGYQRQLSGRVQLGAARASDPAYVAAAKSFREAGHSKDAALAGLRKAYPKADDKDLGLAWEESNPGRLYQVEIPDDAVSRMLDWDAPLSKQPEIVRAALANLLPSEERGIVEQYDSPGSVLYKMLAGVQEGKDVMGDYPGARQASEVLNKAGVAGIRYKDQGSRNVRILSPKESTSGKWVVGEPQADRTDQRYFDDEAEARAYFKSRQTRNFVAFDDKLVKITHKDGSPVTAAERKEFLQPPPEGGARRPAGQRGAINFGKGIGESPSIISLLKRADLSTFLHELGHFQLEVLTDLAAQPDAPAQVQQDMQALLAWFKVPDLATWRSMTTNQRREHHEQFARGFEAYLFEGRAPSDALRGLFARFRSWLIAVYRSLRSLNVELTPEVRQVMDRLVATDAQIAEAQQSDAFAPAYKTAAEAGMDPQQWADYQALGAEATERAQEELGKRSLRDMRWLRTAHGRELKKLQRDVQRKRLAMRDEVATEVFGQRTYRAWQFIRHGATELVEDEPHRLDASALEGLYGETKPAKEPKDKTADEFAEEARRRFLGRLKRSGGISTEEAPDISGDSVQRAVRMAPGLFRKDGRGLDVIAQDFAAEADSYISATEAEDVDGGVQALRDLVRTAMDGSPVFTPTEAAQHAEMQAAEANEAVRDREGEAERAAIKADSAPDWRRLGFGTGGMLARKGGVPPEQTAQMFGYGSADEMVRDLLEAQPPHEVIEGLTDQRMLERYGDLTTTAGVERAADEAVHNEARSRMFLTEANAAQAAIGKPKVIGKAAKNLAEQMIARRRIRDVRPAQHAAAEARAGREARQTADLVARATAMRDRIVQHYAAKASHDAIDDVEKGLKYLRRFAEKGTRENLDEEYLDQIDALLEKYELRRITGKETRKRAGFSEWLAEQEALGLDPVVDRRLVEDSRRRPYMDLSVEEFRGLVDSVRSIDHLGRLKNKLLTAKDQREFKAASEALNKSIRDNANRKVEPRLEQPRGVMKAGKLFSGFAASHRKFASLVREMDGFKDGGAAWELLVRPMNEAGDAETTMRAKATEKLAGLFKKLRKSNLTRKEAIPELGVSLSREAQLMMALNWGNEGNRQRVLDGGLTGKPITAAQVQAVLDRLTGKEWDFVEGVWELLDSYRPAIADQEKRLTGVTPEWIEASPFAVTGGRMIKGGYFPAKYDADLSQRANELEAVTDLKQRMRGAGGFPSTRSGYTKARSEQVKERPLRKDFGVITQHLGEVTHRLAWQEWLVDARRLMKGKSFEAAVREHYGPEILRELKKQLDDVAQGDLPASSDFERVLGHVRSGVSIAGMGWNVMTAAIQPLGITQSIQRVGAKWVGQGLASVAKNPLAAAEEIRGKSEFMRNRARTLNRQLNEILNLVEGEKTSMLKASYFLLIQKMQATVDLPTWQGAYFKAQNEGNDEARSVALADQAVIDSQGSGMLKDLASIERGGPFQKLFTAFYSFFNTTYNRAAESGRAARAKGALGVPQLASDYALLFVLPVIGSVLIKAIARGELDDMDEEEIAERLAREGLSYLFGTMVGVRELAAAVNAKGGYEGPAGTRGISELVKFLQQAAQGEVDKAAVSAAIDTAGIWLHFPSGQVKRFLYGAEALANDKTDNPAALLVGPPR